MRQNYQDIDRIYLFIKDWFESKYQLLVKEREKAGIKKNKSWKTFIDYSQSTDDVYENLEDYNLTKERKNGVGVWWYNSRYGS